MAEALFAFEEDRYPWAIVVIEAGLAVTGTLKVSDVTCRFVNGDGKEDGVLESKLTTPLNDLVAVKYCSKDCSCSLDLFTDDSNVMILVSIC